MKQITARLKRRSLTIALSTALLATPPALVADDASEYLAEARAHLKSGDTKAAVIEMKNALQADPSNAEARRLLGSIYLRTGDAKSAEKELRRAVALGSDSEELRLDLAESLIMQRRFSEAKQRLMPLPTGNVGNESRALTLQGFIEAGEDNADASRASFEQALALTPDNKKASMGLVQLELVAGNQAGALQHLDTILENHPKDEKSLLLKGELLRKMGKPEEALAVFDTAYAANEQNVAALVARVGIKLGLGRTDDAKTDLDRIDAIEKDMVMARYFRGVLAFQDKRYEEAREHIQTVLAALPKHAPSQLIYGLIGYGMGDFEVAEEFLGRFNPGSSAYPMAARVLGATRIKNGEPKRAVEILEPLLDQFPDDPKLLELLGTAYLASGEHGKAAEVLQRVVNADPDTARTRAQLAVGLLGSGKSAEAVEQLESVVEMGGDLVQADILLVTTHMRNKEFEKALTASLELEKRMPDNPVSYNLTGLVYLAQKKFEQAAERFEKSLSVSPEFVTAETNLARIDLMEKDFEAAEKRYQRVLALQPKNLTALIGMAGIAEQKGDSAKMVERLETAIERAPERAEPSVLLGTHYLRSGDNLKALNVANDAASRITNNPSVLQLLARAQSATGEKHSAVRTLERLVEMAPTANNHMLLAMALRETESLSKARQHMESALELQPDNLAAKFNLATLAVQEERFNDALLLAKELQEAAPDKEQPYRLEGAVRLAMGQNSTAMKAFERAYEVQPTAESVRQLANLYEQANRRDDALKVMRSWTKDNPKHLPMRLVLAISLQKWGMDNEAITEYEAIKEQAPKHAVTLNNLAWLYFTKADPRAQEVAKQAYEANPDRPEIADSYGWILLKQGNDPQQALTLLQAAYTKVPTNTEIGYHVAEALHALGRDKEALRTLRRVLDGTGDFPQREDAELLRRKIQGN